MDSKWSCFNYIIFLEFFLCLQNNEVDCAGNLTSATNSIQIESQSRDHRTGPVGGNYRISIHDQLLMTADYPGAEYIWKWAMYSEKTENWCDLTTIYGPGEKAAFICPKLEGVYRAFAKLVLTKSGEEANTYISSGKEICDDSEPCFDHFQIVSKRNIESGVTSAEIEKLHASDVLKSDPIKISNSEYCFIWAYELEEIERINYIYTEPDPSKRDGSYISFIVRIWITEPNAMSESELKHKRPQTDFSKVITRRFQSKGLNPCLRYAHPGVELISENPAYTNDADGEGLYWTLEFRVKTNNIVATLSDITFTIASKQHIALYGCFIAETRLMIDARTFKFLEATRNEIQMINIANSRLPPVLRQFIQSRIKHMYGHYVQYIGRPWDNESAVKRTDLQMFVNPCMTLEFSFAAKGVSYMSQAWLSNDSDDAVRITLPGLTDDAAFLRTLSENATGGISHSNSSKRLIRAYDFAITPTHLVVLTDMSTIYLHPTSITYKGFGYIQNVKNYRPGALVTRRWCPNTEYTYQLLVPAFNAVGNFIVIQIVPTEHMGSNWLNAKSPVCLATKQMDEEKKEKAAKKDVVRSKEYDMAERYAKKVSDREKLECCIHRHEVLKVKSKLDADNVDSNRNCPSNMADCERLVHYYAMKNQKRSSKDGEEQEDKNEEEETLDDKLKFWMSGKTALTERDPHFSSGDVNSAANQASSRSTNFNQHILYEIDRRGTRISDCFVRSGIEVTTEKSRSTEKKLFWLHDVQFTAVERRFMLAVEFKSEDIKRSNFALGIMTAVTKLPIRLPKSLGNIQLDSYFDFSGVLIVRPMNDTAKMDAKRLDGRILTYTTNTAFSCYVIHIDYKQESSSEDIMIYASYDATIARPLSYYSESPTEKNPTGTVRVHFARQHPTLPGKDPKGILKPDVLMTQHGIISVLLRKIIVAASGKEEMDTHPQTLALGSILVAEPLRRIVPFKGTSYIFQRMTADGEIVYGKYNLLKWKKEKSVEFQFPGDSETQADEKDPEPKNPHYRFFKPFYRKTTKSTTMSDLSTTTHRPLHLNSDDIIKEEDLKPDLIDMTATRFLATPYESLMLGSPGPLIVDSEVEIEERGDSASSVEENCPFSDFVVHHIPLDFAEVDYKTRITAELTYLGSTIPLEADLIVEFEDTHGISAIIRSSIEESKDQTVIRKSIDIYTFLTPAALAAMYEYTEKHEDTDVVKEDNTIFSITIRPSIVNLNCDKSLFFKTIQVSVGCNPFTSMRFIPETLNLQKLELRRTKNYKDRENYWTVTKDGDDYEITIPRSKINFGQKKLFKCFSETTDKQGYCVIPKKYSNLFKENMYELHFSKTIVPKFEQFLTSHVRRVTGNIFLYNILGGDWNWNANTTYLDSRCHNLAPHCAPDDLSCGDLSNRNTILQARPWTAHFFEQLSNYDYQTHIYRHYKDCYSPTRRTSYFEDVPIKRALPSIMQKEQYWIFNSTNFNAFKGEKHRNMIFVIRAVVLNTPDNGFTYCQRLDTFFLLHIIGIVPARQPLRWQIYLSIVTFVLFIFVIIYFYFARSSRWQSQVMARRVREEEAKQQREAKAQAYQNEADLASEAIAQWAQRLRDTARRPSSANPDKSAAVEAGKKAAPSLKK